MLYIIVLCLLLASVAQQSKTATTQGSVKLAPSTSSSASKPVTSAPTAAAAKLQESAKKKLEKVDLNAVNSVSTDFTHYDIECLLRCLHCFDTVGQVTGIAYSL